MSLSDRITKSKDSPCKWEPLNLESLEWYPSDTAAPLSTGARENKDFRMLYDRPDVNGSNEFAPLYSRDIPPAPGKNDRLSDPHPVDAPAQEPAEGLSSPQAANSIAETESPSVNSETNPSPPQTGDAGKKEQEGFEAGFRKGEKAGYDAGFAKGEKEGFDAGIVSAAEKASNLENILSEVDGLWTHLVQRYEKQIMQLICRISEKVIYTQAAVNHEIVKEAILHAFEEIPEPEEVTISVNPEDFEYIQLIKEDFFKKIKDLKQVSVLSTPSIQRGGCKIETRSGQVDTTIESRFEAVQRRIIEISRDRV